MAVKKPDGVLQTTTSTGTGDLTLDGTVAGYRTFAQAVTAGEMAWGDEVYYVVQDGTNREWGRATVILSGPTLKRSTGTIIGSTNAGSAISAAGGGVTQVFPAVPDSVKLLTQDRKANGGTIAETGTDNAFSVKQTMAAGLDVTGATALTGDLTMSGDAAINGGNLTLTKTDDGATGAEFESYHNTASAAVSDKVWQHTISAKNASGTKKTAADWYTEWLDATNGSEDARNKFRAMVAGALTEILGFGSDGVTIGNVTPQGKDTLNIKGALYFDNVLFSAGSRQVLITNQTGTQSLSATTWTKRSISNTAVVNSISGASIASNQITLPAGTYQVDAYSTASNVGGNQARLYDATNAAVLVYGTVGEDPGSTSQTTISVIMGEITLAGSTAIELQHYGAESGFLYGNGGTSGMYAWVRFIKVG